MLTIMSTLLPIFSLIVLGYMFKQYNFPGDMLWPLAARLTYFVLFPALLTRTFALADFSELDIFPLSLTVALAVCGVALILIMIKWIGKLDGLAFTSIFQGGIRHNTYVGLAAAAALLGDTGVTIAAIVLITLTPIVNLFSVTCLTVYGKHRQAGWRRVVTSVGQNPLILACFNGFLLNWLGIGLPFGSAEVLGLLGRAALPLGLLVVGAGLDLQSLRAAISPIILASGLKLCLYPLITLLLCLWFNIEPEARLIMVMFTALPCAPSAYMLALELGGDEKLMATILTGQTILAIISIPFILSGLTV